MSKEIKKVVDVEGYDKLTKIEAKFFRMMFTQGAVPFVQGRAGEGKSAIIESIAIKLGYQFIDLRLSQKDELSVGEFPVLNDERDVNGARTFEFAVPDWAVLSNERPTIINFEELNRCRQSVMDACLGILNERRIGSKFRFNKNVYMISTGNMGDADGTVVAEFDSALKNRLNIVKHQLSMKDWLDGYANENVIPSIRGFLKSKPEYFYRLPEDIENHDNFASPRSWSNLSKHVEMCLGDKPTYSEIIDLINEDGTGIVGDSIIKYAEYLEKANKIKYTDILKSFDKYEDAINEMTRPQRSDILESIFEHGLEKLNNKETINFIKFTKVLGDDEVGKLCKFMIEMDNIGEHLDNASTTNLTKIMKEHKKIFKAVLTGLN
jgi:hypothetical protein